MSRFSLQSNASGSSVGTVARTTVLFSGGGQGHADGAALGAKYAFPQGVCVFGATTYIADTSNHVLRAIDEYGAVRTLCGAPGEPGSMDGKGAAARFNLPHSVCCDSKGNIIVTDQGVRVRFVTPDGTVSTLWDAKNPDDTSADPKLATVSLRGVCCTADTIFLTCTATHSVIALPLIAAVAAATSSSAAAAGAAGAGDGAARPASVSTAQHKHAKAHIIAGGNGPGFANGKPLEAQFHSPHGIDADADGHLFVSDTNNHCIRRVSRQVTTFAGAERQAGLKDGSAHKALFNKPYGLCWDARLNCVLVSDGTNKALRRIGDGDVRTVAHLDFEPYDVAVDGDGNVILNAPWIHQFAKIMRDDSGQLRGSLTESAASASARASADRGVTALTAGAKGAAAQAGHGGVAPIETRITFNFGDAKQENTQPLVPGHKHDRELSVTSVSPQTGPVTRQQTVDSLGSPTHAQVAAVAELKLTQSAAITTDAHGKPAGAGAAGAAGAGTGDGAEHGKKKKKKHPGSGGGKKHANDPDDIIGSDGSDARSPVSPVTPQFGGTTDANGAANGKGKDDDAKSCRMCQKDCVLM